MSPTNTAEALLERARSLVGDIEEREPRALSAEELGRLTSALTELRRILRCGGVDPRVMREALEVMRRSMLLELAAKADGNAIASSTSLPDARPHAPDADGPSPLVGRLAGRDDVERGGQLHRSGPVVPGTAADRLQFFEREARSRRLTPHEMTVSARSPRS